jgi:hypothetical protein
MFAMHLIGSHIEQCPERVRKISDASSLANQKAVIQGLSAVIKRIPNAHLSGLMTMITGMRERG